MITPKENAFLFGSFPPQEPLKAPSCWQSPKSTVDVIDRMAVVTPNPLCAAANLEDLEGGWCLVGNHLDVPDNGFFYPQVPNFNGENAD